MRQEQVLVTPELATKFLENNRHNRPIRMSSVRYFEEQLRHGRAGTTHQGIAFDENGDLQDGQHRCMAIIRTGIAWTMWVAYDCPVENFHLVDVGTKRTVADLLDIRGYKNTKHLGAIGQYAWQWYRGRASFTGTTTDDELVKLFDAYPTLIDAPSVKKPELGIPPAMLSFICYLAPSEDFITDLTGFDVAPDGSSNGGKLAEKYIERHNKRRRLNKKVTMALFIKAANDHLAGKEPNSRTLRFTEAAAFPKSDWSPPIPFGADAAEDDEEE